MSTLIIDRQQWARGAGTREKRADRQNYPMCAAHCHMLQNGVSEQDFIRRDKSEAFRKWAIDMHELIIGKGKDDNLTDVNDDPTLSEAQREEILIGLFAKKNINLVFTGV